MRGLAGFANAETRRTIASITRFKRSAHIEVEWMTASSEPEGVSLLARDPSFAIISVEMMRLVYHALDVTKNVVVIAERHDDQLELFDLSVPFLIEPVSFVEVVETLARKALHGENRRRRTPNSIRHVAEIARRVDAPLPTVFDEAAKQAGHDAIAEHNGNRTHAALDLGTNRRWLDRRVPPIRKVPLELDGGHKNKPAKKR